MNQNHQIIPIEISSKYSKNYLKNEHHRNQNLVVTSTQKECHFKLTGKMKSVTGKSKCCSRFEKTAAVAAVAENNKLLFLFENFDDIK